VDVGDDSSSGDGGLDEGVELRRRRKGGYGRKGLDIETNSYNDFYHYSTTTIPLHS